jgi:uncharacterized protein
MIITTLVLGASPNPERYSFRAVRTLQSMNLPVIALGRRDYELQDIRIRKGMPDDIGSVHTIALYLNAKNQQQYYDYILSLQPKRIIFNPGTANSEFENLLTERNIEVVTDCMLAMLHCGRF